MPNLTDQAFVNIDLAIRHERWKVASELARTALDTQPTADLELARAHLDLASGRGVDEVILSMYGLLDRTTLSTEQSQLASYLIATAYNFKRLPTLAREVVTSAATQHGMTASLHVALAKAALVDDDRPKAREEFVASLAIDNTHGAARLGLGELYVAMAAFDDGERELCEVPIGSRRWGAAMRSRAAIAAALGDRQREVALRRELLSGRPDGDLAQSDGISLGHSLAAAGDRVGATLALRTAWQVNPDSGWGRYARSQLTHLEAAPAEAARRELVAFPTTAQKWNYCGPAVLELVLRYFKFEADQDSIAAVVKREHGTPMYEIVSHLASVGVEARRIEGTAERIRAAIDLGCPVIVQEEYSTSSHVAVITGYDLALGVFIAQDPMRHQPMIKSFDFTENASVMFGNGAVVVMGPPEVAEVRRAGADAAGLVEQRHLSLVDEASRRRAKAATEGHEDLSPDEIVRLCDQAIELAPQFRLARYMRLRAIEAQARAGATGREVALQELAFVRLRYGGEEWAHQLHMGSLLERGLYDESFVEALMAHRLDPHDENNLQHMGEVMWLAGDLAAAETHLLAALAEGPDLIRGAENLTAVYLRMVEQNSVDNADEELEPTMPPATLRTRLAHDAETLRRRARHFSTVAVASSPTNPFNHAVAGELARASGELDAAIASMRKCLELAPERMGAAISLASMLEAQGKLDEAMTVRSAIVARAPQVAKGYAGLAALHRRREQHREAEEVLIRGLATVGDGRESLLDPLFDVMAHLGSNEAAAAQLRVRAEAELGDDDFVRAALDVLESNRQRGHAIALARVMHVTAPQDPGAVWRLARLLDDAGVAKTEATELLTTLVGLVPDVPVVRVRLAWQLVGNDPAAALALLEPVLDSESPDVFDAYAAALAGLGQTADADRALSRALKAAPSEIVGLARLANRHTYANRYDRALALAQRIDMASLASHADLDDDDRLYIEDAWMTAHRLAGHASSVLSWAQARCENSVPAHLAFEMYYAFRRLDRSLAARAADVKAAKADDASSQLEWKIIAASLRAKLGKPAELETLAATMPNHGGAWAELSDAYTLCKRFDESNAAAERAYQLDPLDGSAFTAFVAALTRQNRIAEAVACATTFAAARPWEHQGPERLGILYAKLGRVAEALEQSDLAVDAAPYCHVSQQSRALALFAAGDLAEALHFARQAAGNEPAADDDDGDSDDALLIAALTSDRASLERGLAALERSEPGVFPEYRARLVLVAESGGVAAELAPAEPVEPVGYERPATLAAEREQPSEAESELLN